MALSRRTMLLLAAICAAAAPSLSAAPAFAAG